MANLFGVVELLVTNNNNSRETDGQSHLTHDHKKEEWRLLYRRNRGALWHVLETVTEDSKLGVSCAYTWEKRSRSLINRR